MTENAKTKPELIKAAAERNDLTVKAIEFAFDAIFGTIESELEAGREVHIPKFGKFSVKHVEARKGRNPQTGGEILIDAKDKATFKASSVLNKVLNK